MNKREVVVLSAARSPIGTFGGSLAGIEPIDLATEVIKATIERAGVTPDQIGYVTCGAVIPTEKRFAYISRVSATQAGIPETTPSMDINRLCASGLQAIVTSAQQIELGDYDYALGGGVEVMSRGAYLSTTQRNGARMGDSVMLDSMVNTLNDPFGAGHMGNTAENLAKEHSITREEQDELALESQKRAMNAINEGRFKEQIVPITLKSRKGDTIFDTDEHPRANATMESLTKMRPAFEKEGTVTAGNASGINDGAAFVVLADAEAAQTAGLKPMAKLVGYAVAGVNHTIMGYGPVPATKAVMEKTGLTVDQMDVVESNEAFAAQACAVSKDLGFDPAKTNVNGGAIALGHPIGASGAVIATKAIYELQRVEGKYALVTMCIGGGQGIAVIFERM
ncbi:MAG: acetyl-CoA C-acyltransferase family protein [Propionibacteriaceae bacterium]|nr:acetyl-CoA C-acyltransferase family protein [Propionibacteriaceae bacterium]